MASIPERPLALQREGPPRSPASEHSRWLRTRLLHAVSTINIAYGLALEPEDEDDGYPGEDDPTDWVPLHLAPHPCDADDDWRAFPADPPPTLLAAHLTCADMLGEPVTAQQAYALNTSPARLLRFRDDLVAHGAPLELIEAATAALPATPVEVSTASPPTPLPELAALTLRDGAVSNTLSAALLTAELESLPVGPHRDALAAHLELTLRRCDVAWASLCWMLCVGDRDVRSTLQAVWQTLVPTDDAPATAQQCVSEVLQPVFASLLALDLAA